MNMSIARVALDVPLSTLFDYTVAESVVVGQRVIVPFGKRQSSVELRRAEKRSAFRRMYASHIFHSADNAALIRLTKLIDYDNSH